VFGAAEERSGARTEWKAFPPLTAGAKRFPVSGAASTKRFDGSRLELTRYDRPLSLEHRAGGRGRTSEVAVYEQYYGLAERPFDLSPNPRFLFLSPAHREALNHLRYGLSGRPGLTVVVGEVGTGKTTLVKAVLEARAKRGSIVHLSNPTLTRSEFFESLAFGFGFDEASSLSKSRFLRTLESTLTASATTGTLPALIVDEAQSLPYELLEEIRFLTNIEGASGGSLAVALVGQPELATRLNDPALRQLKQRVVLRCELTPLNLQETAAYIIARVRVAGGNAFSLFSREAIEAIYEHSNGIPRSISVICDNALVSGLALDRRPVGRDIVAEVCRDFELGGRPQPVLADEASPSTRSNRG
jgi:general secretion pathway protein A